MTKNKWNDQPVITQLYGFVKSCHVLLSGTVLVNIDDVFHFYSTDLVLVLDIELKDIVENLE